MVCLAALVATTDTAYAAEGTQAIEMIESQPELKLEGRRLLIEIPGDDYATIEIYALTGQLVKQVTVTPGTTTIDLPSGYYIVRVGQFAKRIAIK